jgi:hypothetical protein
MHDLGIAAAAREHQRKPDERSSCEHQHGSRQQY